MSLDADAVRSAGGVASDEGGDVDYDAQRPQLRRAGGGAVEYRLAQRPDIEVLGEVTAVALTQPVGIGTGTETEARLLTSLWSSWYPLKLWLSTRKRLPRLEDGTPRRRSPFRKAIRYAKGTRCRCRGRELPKCNPPLTRTNCLPSKKRPRPGNCGASSWR